MSEEVEEMKLETVQKVASLATFLNHLRQNRIELALLALILYVTGIGSDLWAQTAGMCV
jgi:hypothetical protein